MCFSVLVSSEGIVELDVAILEHRILDRHHVEAPIHVLNCSRCAIGFTILALADIWG